ncbi:hypothetical protein ACFL0X_00020 [Nanoarchaeota archaeon]
MATNYSAKQELKRMIQEIHKLNPAIIFYTQSSAHNLAIALDQTWKEAYPNEKSPKVWGVNPRRAGIPHLKTKIEAIKETINLNKEKILILDECRGNPPSPLSIPQRHTFLESEQDPEFLYPTTTIAKGANMIREEVGSDGKNIYVMGGNPHAYANTVLLNSRESKKRLMSRAPTGEIYRGHNLPKRVAFGSEALKILNEIRKVGRDAGKELHKELEENRSLEHKLMGVISITGFITSLFFLSSNITGNTVANISSQTSSLVGSGLLVVGLIAGAFWMKMRES